MKFKYYLRGLAMGILFTTMVYLISSIGEKDNLSSTEIIKRARALGMVMQEETLFDTSTETSEEVSEEASVNETSLPKSESSILEASVESSSLQAIDSDTSKEELKAEEHASSLIENSNIEDSNAASSVEKTESSNVSSSISNSNSEKVSFTIENGMSAQKIINILKEKGIIEDTGAFYEYLNDHEYSTSIQPGNYEVQKDISYERLAKLITHTK